MGRVNKYYKNLCSSTVGSQVATLSLRTKTGPQMARKVPVTDDWNNEDLDAPAALIRQNHFQAFNILYRFN